MPIFAKDDSLENLYLCADPIHKSVKLEKFLEFMLRFRQKEPLDFARSPPTEIAPDDEKPLT